MPDGSLSLHDGVAVLKKHYGSPAPLPTADPFELILWENVAYLASPRRRHEVVQEQGSYSRTYAASRQVSVVSVLDGPWVTLRDGARVGKRMWPVTGVQLATAFPFPFRRVSV